MGGLTERQKKLAGEFQKAERSGIGPILAIYRREMDSWGNDCQKLVDLLCSMEARLDSPFSDRVGTDDSIYWALADTIKVFASTHLSDRDYRLFREHTGLTNLYD